MSGIFKGEGLIISGIEGTDDIEQHKQSPEGRNA